MPHRAFTWFILPSLAAMVLFIALPILSAAIQSLYVEHDQVLIETENCSPFKCETTLTVDVEATNALNEDQPLGKFNGFGTYSNRNHLAVKEVKTLWSESEGIGSFLSSVFALPFYKALTFTYLHPCCQ